MPKRQMKPIDYLDALNTVAAALTARSESSHLSRYELDQLNDAAERGDNLVAFADWVIWQRKQPRFGPVDERDNLGDETISPKDVAA